MYSAKARGKNRVAFFEPEMATAVAARHTLTEALQRAVAAEEFVLHYQPIFDVATGRIDGRRGAGPLDAPDAGHGLAGRVHPVAEASDLILEIGRWVLEQSCRAGARSGTTAGPSLRDSQSASTSPAGSSSSPTSWTR